MITNQTHLKKYPISSDATTVVRAENLGFCWPGGWFRSSTPLFTNVNFSISPGEMVGLSGPSGSGKSTLGNILLGLLCPSQGQVYWKDDPIFQGEGKNFPRGKTVHLLRCKYQKIFQDPLASFCPKQTLGEALGDVVFYHGLGNIPLDRHLERLGLDPDMLNRYPHQLSGGELQRMALIRVMLLKPSFIVADEPTSRLDLSVQAHIIRLIAGFSRSDGCAVLLISHDAELIQAVCDRCIYIDSLTCRGSAP